MKGGALRHRDLRWFVLSRFLWALASQMVVVAVAYQVWNIGRDPLDLGLLGLAQFVPFALLALPAGQLADVVNRRRLLMFCYGLILLCALGLAVISASSPTSTGPIIAVMGLYGAARALTYPVGTALVPNLVPVESLPSAVAFYSSSFQLATVAGPALGGFLLLKGATAVYGVSIGLLVLALATLTLVRHDQRPGSRKAGYSIRGMFAGVRFVRSTPSVLSSISLDMFAVLLGGVVALLPIFATDILRVGPTGLGLMRATPAAGALLGAAVLGFRPLRRRVGPALFGSVVAFGVATVAFALSTNFALSMICLFAMGVVDIVSVYVRNLLVQLSTPDAIRGRVSAVNSMFVGASNELGDFRSGLTAAWLGPVTAAAVGGVVTVAVAVTWAILFPSIRRMNRFPPQYSDLPVEADTG